MKKVNDCYVVQANDVETVAFDWGNVKIFSEPKVTGAQRMSFGQVVLQPGMGHERHNHPGCDEIIFVLSGEGEQMLDELCEPTGDGTLRVSALNQLLRHHAVDALVALMDLDKLRPDEPLAVPAIAWYPNHLAELTRLDRLALAPFSHVAALAPTDAAMIARAMPQTTVRWVPHAVEPPAADL